MRNPLALVIIGVTLGSAAITSLPASRPEDVGVSTVRLYRIPELMQRRIAAHDISGAVTFVARHARVVHFEAHGFMDLEAHLAMRRDAMFSIASMSKPITTVAVLMMLEEGKLQLSDPVSKFVPQLHNMKLAGSASLVPDITVRDLLTHVSGLASGGAVSTGEYLSVEHRKGEALADVVPRFGTTTLDFAPGTRWSYSPFAGFDTLGRIVEIVSGQRFDRFLQERVFRPLGMHDTSFLPTALQLRRLTTIYHRSDSGGPLTKAADDGWLADVAPTYFAGSGGLFGTTEDYARFAQMLLNRGELDGTRLLGTKTVDLMLSLVVPDTTRGRVPGIGFGLGGRVYQATSDTGVQAGSYGWDGSYGTHFWIDPKTQLVAIIMIQDENSDGQISRDFETAVTQAIVREE